MAQRYNIVLKSDNERLAAEKASGSDSLIAGRYDKSNPDQVFDIYPDGRILHSKDTHPDRYDGVIVLKSEEYTWIIEGSDPKTIRHQKNKNVWTFGKEYEPLEIKPEKDAGDRHKLEFVPA